MNVRLFLLGFVGASTIAGASLAASISALGNDGTVYNVDVVTGVASIAGSVPDPASNTDVNSPNGLGVAGATITNMTLNSGDGTEEIFVDGVEVNSFATGTGQSVAAGDTERGVYTYVERNFNVVSVDNFGAGTATVLGDLDGAGLGATLGDVAISGSTGFLSFGQSFGIFDLNNVAAGFSTTFSQDRFVGLGFADSVLYGVNNSFELFQWSGVAAAGSFTKVADITGVKAGTLLTDASSAVVPLPAAGWMLLAGLGGLAAMRRRQKA